MAYLTSDKYKKKIYADVSYHYLKIFVNETQIDNDYVRDLTLDDDVFEEDKFTLGSAIPQVIVLKLDNICLPCQPNKVNNIKIEYGLEVDDNEVEWLPIGEYDIVKEPDITYSDYTTFTLNDYMNRFDKEYDASDIVPCTRYELVQDMCLKCNVELGATSFLNDDIIVNTFDNTIKAKKYLSFISERAGGFAKIGRDGKLYIKSFSDVDEIELSDEESESANLSDYDTLKTITGLIYEDATRKFSFGTNDGKVIFLSSDNPFVATEEEVENIYNAINGLSFQSVDLKIWADPSYDSGDILKVIGLKTFIQKRWNYGNGFFGSYKTKLKDVGTNSNVEKISNSKKIKAIKSTLNEITGEIDLLTKEIIENSGNIAELNITTDTIKSSLKEVENDIEANYNEMVQTINSLLVSLQKTGGSNLIKNSVMFAYDDDNNPIDWNIDGDGILTIQNSADSISAGAVSGHTFTLLNKKVSQRVYVCEDKNDIPEAEKKYYTFSTKIKKNATGSCYVKIFNSNEEYLIKLDPGESSYYSDFELKKLLPKDNYYNIEFYGSADSGATFTDNMFSLGELKTTWTQAEGEIMNTQVNINLNGVLVKSIVYDGDYTVMSPLEFAGYSNINGVITKVFSLNKDTTIVKKLEVEDEVKMVPIKIVSVKTGDLQGLAFVPSERSQQI
ncbi:MAG: hypothetical protein HFI86_05910 [Bacilli bacterium]|nr:hypothetical protein [Bacilli bacterium]